MTSKKRSSRSKRSRRSRRSKRSKKVRLVKVGRSPNKDKKYRAYFSDGRHTDFGAKGYSDFTKHKDSKRRARYITRHKSRENWRNYRSPGSLSRYILWNKPTLKASIADYKRRFKL